MRRTVVSLAIALALGAAHSPLAAPASAETAGACVGTGTWTFNPPLGFATTSGSITVVGTLQCPQVTTSGGVSFPGGPGSTTLSYTGSCAFATVSTSPSGPLLGALVGGVAYTQVGPDAFVGAWALVPDQVCNQRVAQGAGVSTGVS